MIWGIKANGDVEMQAIRYPTGKWTEVKARSHCQEKGGEFHPATQGAQAIEGLQVAYAARFKPIIDGDRVFAKIYAIDLSKCKNKWRVTKEAMQRAAKTILGAKLLGPPPAGEEGDVIESTCREHLGKWKEVGKFRSYEQNGVTYGLAEVTEPYAAKNVKESRWKATSPKIIVNATRRGDGEIEVTDFRFDHVLFVDDPAFPKAGVVQVCDSPEACGFPGNSLAGAVERALEGAHLLSIEDQELSALEKAVETARGLLQSVERLLEFSAHGGPEQADDFTVTAAKAAKTDAEMMALGLHPEKKSNNERTMLSTHTITGRYPQPSAEIPPLAIPVLGAAIWFLLDMGLDVVCYFSGYGFDNWPDKRVFDYLNQRPS